MIGYRIVNWVTTADAAPTRL